MNQELENDENKFWLTLKDSPVISMEKSRTISLGQNQRKMKSNMIYDEMVFFSWISNRCFKLTRSDFA